MYVFVDTETTGLPRRGEQPRIVSIAWMMADNPGTPRVFTSHIIKPDGFIIPPAAAAIHGISTERATRVGRPLCSVLDEFAYDFRTLRPVAVVAHNATFDMPIINAEYVRTGMPNPCGGTEVRCTMRMSRKIWPGQSAKLGDVYAKIFNTPIQNAHDAGYDVWACARIFFSIR